VKYLSGLCWLKKRLTQVIAAVLVAAVPALSLAVSDLRWHLYTAHASPAPAPVEGAEPAAEPAAPEQLPRARIAAIAERLRARPPPCHAGPEHLDLVVVAGGSFGFAPEEVAH
jgi:hypothetical protein